MAKKAKKKVPEPKKHDKRPTYHFTCLGCKLQFDVKASNMTEAQGNAFNRHDDWHMDNGSFCESNNFELTDKA